MSFFGLFPEKENHYENLSRILAGHETAAKQNLSAKHPHVGPILQKHGIDLSKIRHHGAKVATSATILGALLAFPRLVHAPTQHPTFPNPDSHQTNVLDQTDKQRRVTPPIQPSHQAASLASNVIQNSITTPTKPNDNDEDGSGEDGREHQHGRRELAPPKEHGLHDLGYHEGAERNPDKVSAPGAHPEETIEHGKAEG